jgi:DNA-binding NtrC family response regulator
MDSLHTTPDPAASAVPTGRSILVVDDEVNFVILLERVLSKRGYKVRTALTAENALLQAQKTNFDLALLDIRIGEVDGLALLAELKRCSPDTKIIVMTAFPTYGTQLISFRHGASAYVAKPVSLSALLEMIDLLVKNRWTGKAPRL